MSRDVDARDFRELVSGRRRGWAASLARGGLRLLEAGYALGSAWRNQCYDRGRLPIASVDVPVISVGNVTVGGTGKTPLVAWLANWLSQRDVRVVVISRGYGAKGRSRNDEALALQDLLPHVPHLQNPDRAAAARIAIDELGSQAIVLDDGFQHRRLARDLDLVLIDALEPLGYGHLLPRGLLRESLRGLRRAHALIVTRSGQCDDQDRQRLTETLRLYAPTQPILWSEHQPTRLRNSAGRFASLQYLDGRPGAAFCGLGNPAGFRATLEELGVQLLGWREFPDHHDYSPADADELALWARRQRAEWLLCTHKDLVKLRAESLGATPLWSLDIELDFRQGRAEMEQLLEPLVQRARKA